MATDNYVAYFPLLCMGSFLVMLVKRLTIYLYDLQEEYNKEGIQWKNIEFIDNTECLELFAKRPHGLLCLLDEECK